MFFVYGVYNNSLEMMFIRLGLLTRKGKHSASCVFLSKL